MGGWCDTYSVIILTEPLSYSQVSPNNGLKGLVVLLIQDSKPAKLNATTYASLKNSRIPF